MSNAASDPPDEVLLYRMVWHPDAWHDGELTATGAFQSRDLKGGDDYVSVDRADLHNPEEARGRALDQQAKANPPAHVREEAWNIELLCGDVRNLEDQSGRKPLTVSEKREGYHPAHCGITNVSGQHSKTYIAELRTKLLRLVVGQHCLLPRAKPATPGTSKPGETA